jgi:RimJ/RimL family protein N-acetyltransferase
MNLSFKPFPVLTTNRLVLRRIKRADVNEVLFLRSDERVLHYLDKVPAKTKKDAYSFIKIVHDAEKNFNGITWGITLKNETKVIGTIGFWRMEKEHFRAEIGYVLHPDYWEKGITHEALSEAIKYGFEVMKLHSIEANVNPANTASIKLLEKNGFEREAYYKENYFFNGRFLDSAVYSLLEPANGKLR